MSTLRPIVFSLLVAVLATAPVQAQYILDFGYAACRPCRLMDPIVERLKSQGRDIRYIDNATPEGQALANQYGVTRFPTFVAVDASGREIERTSPGVVSESTLIALCQLANNGLAPVNPVPTPKALPVCRLKATDRTPYNGMESYSRASGVVVEDNGVVAKVFTCAHLFRDAKPPYVVTFTDGKAYEATLLSIDRDKDLAICLIKSPGVNPLPIGDFNPQKPVVFAGFGGDGTYREATGQATAVNYNSDVRSVNAQVRQGDSGGPAMQEGTVVGILFGDTSQVGGKEVFLTTGRSFRQFYDNSCSSNGGSGSMACEQPYLPPNYPTQPRTYQPPNVVSPPTSSSPENNPALKDELTKLATLQREQIESLNALSTKIKPCECNCGAGFVQINQTLTTISEQNQTLINQNAALTNQLAELAKPHPATLPPREFYSIEPIAPVAQARPDGTQ